ALARALCNCAADVLVAARPPRVMMEWGQKGTFALTNQVVASSKAISAEVGALCPFCTRRQRTTAPDFFKHACVSPLDAMRHLLLQTEGLLDDSLLEPDWQRALQPFALLERWLLAPHSKPLKMRSLPAFTSPRAGRPKQPSCVPSDPPPL
ncbi:hypothetical protein T492DRAFT_880867, partial [Pavlovales sp. CCMP2436]